MIRNLARRSVAAPAEVRYVHVRLDSLGLTGTADAPGVFAGYGSVHGVTDSYGTRMMPGCWRSGGLDEEPYPLLWMHDPTRVLGTFTAREDEKGLWIAGRYDDTDDGTRARAQALSGSAPGLSVGFEPLETQVDDENALIRCRLVEVSQIAARFASTPGAAMVDVRRQVDEDATLAAQVRAASTARTRLLLTDLH